ncbi:C40 family peptidase [Streptomyces hoynatensis]|uniref:NlpC/P60 family protein n=1 Tax=Streptomyces hoynatensis TaxID=1141874 RepID=A0A3A9YFY6_9ACTN|nr:C40 family peptidase [Streptomyces hoynatensis]RKN35941.1 NlpC/P60 family protein [Streptomyces hoynatensis]
MAVNGDDVVKVARTALGVKYVWGGNSLTSGIDCSGLVQQTYARLGINLPRVTYEQINVGASVSIGKLQAGDLVFFDTDKSTRGPDHVGIYIGGGKFIHAPRTGDVVKISSLGDSYYANRFMAGRRISGVAAGTGRAAGTTSVQQTHEQRATAVELAERYGMSYAFFDSQPELKVLLKKATKDQWTPTRFQGELKNTKWWRQNSESAREAQVLARTDPATYNAQISAQRAAIQQIAVQMGAILSDKVLDKAARDSVTFKWNDAMIQNFLGRYVDFQENRTLGGQAGSAAQQITNLAYNLGIQVSDQTVKNYAQYVVRGVATMDEVQSQLRAQAAGTYPGFEEQIMGGDSIRDIAQPYIQAAASELDMADTDLDVFTPLIRNAMNRQDRQGNPAPMTLSDFQRSLRDDPRWGQTDTVRDNALSVGRQVLQAMGLVGNG